MNDNLLADLLETQSKSQERKYTEFIGNLYKEINKNPFRAEIPIKVNLKEEAEYIIERLKKDGIKYRLESGVNIPDKTFCVVIVVSMEK